MKILLAGLGSIGQRHARNLRTLLGDEAELLAYRVRGLRHVITPQLEVEPDAYVETRYGLTAYSDLNEALAREPDAVFVTNPNSLHMPVALAAARAGCHLFIEKPVSHTLDGVADLVELVQRRQLTCLVGYQFRFHPGFRLLQTLLAEHAIGPIVAARFEFGEYLPGWHPYEDYRQMHVSRRDQGGGVLLAQIHDLDCAFALFGMPRRVSAVGGHLSGLEIDVEDTASVLMEYIVDGRSVPVHVQQDCVRRPPTRTYELIGDRGRITFDVHRATVCVWDEHGGAVRRHTFEGFERNQMFLDELGHFLACLRGEQAPIVPIHDGVQSLRMALAARESMEHGRVVELG